MKKIILMIFSLFICLFAFVGCTNDTKEVEYEVSFVTNTEENIKALVVKKDEAISEPTVMLTKDGYTFLYWSTKEENGEKVIFPYTVTSNITLYAYWTINNPINSFTVAYNTNGGNELADSIVSCGDKLEQPNNPIKSGYSFVGWYSDEGLNSLYNFDSLVEANITLYAKWILIDQSATAFTVTFDFGEGLGSLNQTVAKGGVINKVTTPIRKGYSFDGWYTTSSYEASYIEATPVNSSFTLYAKWVYEEYTVTFNTNGGTSLSPLTVPVNTYASTNNPSKDEYLFGGWFLNLEFSGEEINLKTYRITTDVTMYAKWIKLDNAITYYYGGDETAAFEWNDDNSALCKVEYKLASENNYKVADNELIRNISNTVCRVDVLGLTPGSYDFKITTSKTSVLMAEGITVTAQDRSGFAHFNYTSGVGAYNDDGTLKENAIVLYVTDATKNTVTLSYKGTTVSGIGNILNSVGMDIGNGTTSNGSIKTNTNQGILKILANDNIPLVIRIIGTVSDSGLYQKGLSNPEVSLINGLTEYDSTGYGGTSGDNGHMARMKSGKDITIEGVGYDATIDGFGFHFMCESSSPDLGKSFEVRNLKFINTPEDAIGMEGIQGVYSPGSTTIINSASDSSDLLGSVERCWIHNNEFYGPKLTKAAESDKTEGDGSVDFKRGQYFTCSYNYFEGCHKTNLVGSSDSSLQFNLTYHHNYWYLCKARGPLARQANIHMYNNVIYGTTDYAMNTRANAYIYSESNLFYLVKNPQRVDDGAIKSYNDSFSSCIGEMNGTVVANKSQAVTNSCSFKYRNIDYSKFDTESTLSYIPTNDYYLQESVTDARLVVEAKTGVTKARGVKFADLTLDDVSVIPSSISPNVVSTLPTTLTPGKISKAMYVFTINNPATVSISYSSEALSETGVLINKAGEALLIGSGMVVLVPGTYAIQPMNLQAGDSLALTMGTFKEVTISSISFEAYDSEAVNQALISSYNQALANIPSAISYTEECYSKIKAALSAYNCLGNLQSRVDYSALELAFNAYKDAGKAFVEAKITNIGTVNESSGVAINEAKAAYDAFIKEFSDISIANYNDLVEAITSYQVFAVNAVKNAISSLANLTITSEDNCLTVKEARSLYEELSEEQKVEITNLTVLVEAEGRVLDYYAVPVINIINTLKSYDNIVLADKEDISEARAMYDELSDEIKAHVSNYANLQAAEAKIAYLEAPTKLINLINSIGTVSTASKSIIEEARALYDSLDENQKLTITNYNTLVAAEASYEAIANAAITCTFDGAPSNSAIYVSGNYKATSATCGGVSYTKGLKLESDTVITFTTTSVKTLTLHVTAGKVIKVDGVDYTADSNGVIVINNFAAGNHSIAKKETNTILYALFLE